jgi:saccharopepsin
VFDTGSEYLAITSVLCDDETAGNFKFKKYDPLSGGFVERDQMHKRCKTMAYDMHKSDSNKILSKASSKLTYGSAKLQGFIWQDFTCLNPLRGNTQSAVQLKMEIKQNKCAYFQFLSLYKSQGLGHDSDGILGLSPHKDMKKKKLHYLWSLKDNGIIDRAVVSFSITSKEMGEVPYALFGGYNSSQIVGGAEGLKTFKNFENWLGTWALEGQGMYYGDKPMQKPGEDTSYPAIIDTGSSQLSIPPDVFEKIRTEWAQALPNLDCTSDKTFCHVKDSCENIAQKLKPVGFQMSDYVFEINPEQYLYKSSHKKCYFVVHKCRLPGKNKNLFLIGDAFLKHFYSVYDFDQDTVSLGINMHSKGKVSMFKPGSKPQAMVQAEPRLLDPEVDDSYIQTTPLNQTSSLHQDIKNTTSSG